MMKKVKIAYNLGTNKSLTTPELEFLFDKKLQ